MAGYLLPPSLRQVAGLEKHVVMLGMGSRFEIWNENTLNVQTQPKKSLASMGRFQQRWHVWCYR